MAESSPEAEIRAVFAGYPDVLYGFADIAYSPYAERYASALVFAVPYGGQLTSETYTEPGFEDGIVSARGRLETIAARIEDVLRRLGVDHWVPPVAQENETDLLAPFSFKFAAVNAGLGWIGKNDVVITRRYGPRVRLSAILIDASFPYGKPIVRSECPEGCTACVDVCPCQALKNRLWTIDTQRAEMIDYRRCNRMRSAFIPRLGRKSACGLCLAACPFGTPAAPGGEAAHADP